MERYSDVFADVSFDVEAENKTVQKIETSGKPVFSKPRQLTPEKLKIAKNASDEMQRLCIIRPSKSLYSSPLHMVPKKEIGDWRPCGDNRSLNLITARDSYSMPQLSMVELNGRQIFSKLDLVKTYHQMPLHSDDIEKNSHNYTFWFVPIYQKAIRSEEFRKNASFTMYQMCLCTKTTYWLHPLIMSHILKHLTAC